jgi:hypothetical protein
MSVPHAKTNAADVSHNCWYLRAGTHVRLSKTTYNAIRLLGPLGAALVRSMALARRSGPPERCVPAPETSVGLSDAGRQHRGRRSRSIQPVSRASFSQGVQKRM